MICPGDPIDKTPKQTASAQTASNQTSSAPTSSVPPSSDKTPPDQVTLRITSDPAKLEPTRLAIEDLAKHLGFDEKSVWNIGLCVNEAMANITRHAYGGRTDQPVEVHASGADGGIRIELRDWGTGKDPSKLPPKPPDPMRPGGLGLICLKQMLDTVNFEPQSDGMRLLLVKKLSSEKTE